MTDFLRNTLFAFDYKNNVELIPSKNLLKLIYILIKLISMTNNIELGSAPLGKLMAKLAIPSITAFVINILYNIVDRIYIGHIPGSSSLPLTGVGICLPIITLISAFSSFAGSGGAPLAAIELGKSEKESDALDRAKQYLSNAFVMLLFFSVILTSFFFIFKDSLLMAFGASKDTLPFASDYLSIYLIGTIFVQLSIGLNPFITAQGKAKTAMVSMLIGACLNLILDPIFIFTFNLGVKGAAIATIISQAASAIWILLFLTKKSTVLRLDIRHIKFKLKTCLKIASLGISPFIMQSTESAIFIIFNTGLQRYGGDLYVATMTIMQSLMQLCFCPLQGFTSGIQPIISYNYGAKNYDRVKMVIKRMTSIGFAFTIVAFLVITNFPEFFAKMFATDTALISLAGKTVPVYFGAMWIFGIQMCAQTTFVGLGKAKISLFIALLRKVILLIPLALILPLFFGVDGIFWAEPIASMSSAITSGILLFFCYKKLK